MDLEFAVVIPVGSDRRENLERALECLVQQTLQPSLVVLVCDGPDAWLARGTYTLPTSIIHAPKHEPGMEQPRNLGARLAADRRPSLTHVAFLDTDVLVGGNWLEEYAEEIVLGGPGGFYYGPYEFMPRNGRPFDLELKLDNRWAMFEDHIAGDRYKGDLSKGLGAYSGNLVWNIRDFERVGGFWNEIHHGACEDGELGLRAVHMGIPIGQVPRARGWHLYHGGDPQPTQEWLHRRLAVNKIDVPKLKERHPWVELGQGGKELFVVDEDGKRFNVRCECGWEGNTALLWRHLATCPNQRAAA